MILVHVLFLTVALVVVCVASVLAIEAKRKLKIHTDALKALARYLDGDEEE